MKCINCEQEQEGRFCQHCGQPATVRRMSWQQLLSDLQARMFGFDSRFMRTSIDLLLRPGQVVDTYFSGNRQRYMGPAAYLLLTLTALVLFIELLGISMQDFYGVQPSVDPADKAAVISEKINHFIYNNYRLINFFMIPLYAMLSSLLFRKAGYNFVEHTVLYCYMHAFSTWFIVVLVFIFFFFSFNGFALSALLSLLYAFWFNLSTFRYQARGWVLLKALGVQLLAVVLFTILGLVGALLLL